MRNTLGRALTPVGCQNAFVMFYILLCFQCLHFPYLGVYRNREDIQKRMNKLAQMGKNKENGTSVGQGGTEEDPKIKKNKKTAPKNKREDEYVAFWNIFY